MENSKPNKSAVGLLSAGHLITDSYGGFISPILPFIAAKIGISLAVASMLLSFSHLTSSIMQPVFGYISDMLKRRFFIFAGILFASVFIGLIGISNSVWFLGAALVLGSLGVGFYHPQATGLVPYFSGKKLNDYMGIFIACGAIGYAVGPFVSSFLVGNFGLSATTYTIPVGILLAFLMLHSLPKIPADLKRVKNGSFKQVCGEICSNRSLLVLTYISIIKALVVITFVTFMPFLWKDKGYSVLVIGAMVGSFSTLGGLSSYLGSKIANYTGRKKVFVYSLLPILPCGLGVLYFDSVWPLMSGILFALTGFFTMLSVSVNIIMAQNAAPDNKSMVSGIIGGFSWGLMGLALTPLGFLAAKFGVKPVLAVVSLIPLSGLYLIRYIKCDE